MSKFDAVRDESAYTVGKCYLIRTVTYFWTGRVMVVMPGELVLEDAAWIGDTGRYHQAVDEASLIEIEPRDGPVVINRAAIVDAVEWHTALPRSVK